jgi:hypothetical protein
MVPFDGVPDIVIPAPVEFSEIVHSNVFPDNAVSAVAGSVPEYRRMTPPSN